jgi:hypothetical protein
MTATTSSILCSCLTIAYLAGSAPCQESLAPLPDTEATSQKITIDSVKNRQNDTAKALAPASHAAEINMDSLLNRRKDTLKTGAAAPQAGGAQTANQPADSTNASPVQQGFWKTFFSQYYVKDSSGAAYNSKEPYEGIGVIEIGSNIYTKPNARFTKYIVDPAGFSLGVLIPLRFSHVSMYYHARGSFNGAVSDVKKAVTYFTATNELRAGKSFYLGGIPCQFLPAAGIGYNNGMIITGMQSGNIIGLETHYYFHWEVGLCIRQLFVYQERLYSIGLNADFERAFIADEDTKQHLVISLLLGI